MPVQPYQSCPCGSGKKLKWCCAAIWPQIERAFALAESDQGDAALRLLDKLESETMKVALVRTQKARVLWVMNQPREAVETLNRVTSEFPDFAPAYECAGDFYHAGRGFESAGASFRAAAKYYSPEAADQIGQTLIKLGECELELNRPLAAWAAWQRATKLKSDSTLVHGLLAENFKDDERLPRSVRDGLALKPPDALDVFNEDRRAKWDRVMEYERAGQFDDLAPLLEELVAADPSNPTAWYNLALVCAWNADNDRSIEALERYVGLEDDFDAAARAWDLCELLRCGEGASISSDFEQFGAIYQVVDPRRLSELLASCPHVRMVVLTNGEPYGMQWLDPPEPQGSEPVPLIGRQPRHLAWLRLILRELLGVMSMSESDLQTVQQKLDPLIAPAAKPVKSFRARAAPEQFLSDLVMSVPSRESVDAEPVAVRVQKYFEERWIHEPLRALGGRAPVDAAGNKVLQRKLEGVIRFRERLVAGHGIDYDFGRLRALLGLVPGPRATQAAAVDSPSVGQQCAPAPGSLSDEDLLAAYRAAGTRTIARETLDLGIEMIRRESLATQTDMIAVFRRLIADAIGNERLDDALRLVDDGLGYDARFYSARNRCALEALRAKIFLARRQPEAACELFQKLFDEDPNNLDLVAGAVEDFLSAGVFDTARQFAERGLQKAQAQRQGRLQGQFREYLEAASTRR